MESAQLEGKIYSILSQDVLTERSIQHKKEPIVISRPDNIGQRIRYSHINNIAGVITGCRKSEHGNILDHNCKRNNVLEEGQLLLSATTEGFKTMYLKGNLPISNSW